MRISSMGNGLRLKKFILGGQESRNNNLSADVGDNTNILCFIKHGLTTDFYLLPSNKFFAMNLALEKQLLKEKIDAINDEGIIEAIKKLIGFASQPPFKKL